MSFKPIYRFLKIKYSPAKKEDDKNSYSFTYDLIKGHNENGQEIKESFVFKSYDEPVQKFKDALQGLCPHLTEYCELPANYSSRIKVRGVSITHGEHEDGRKIPGLIITRVMQYKKSHGVLVLNTPFKQSEFLTEAGGDESKLLSDECIEVLETLFAEAIGDLASIRMSTYNKRAKKGLPPGHQGRIVDGEYFPWGDRNYYRDELNGLYLYSYPQIAEYEKNYADEKGLIKCIHCGKYNIPLRNKCWYCHNPKSLHTLETIDFENESIVI